MKKFYTLFCGLAVLASVSVQAQDTLHVPGDYSSIQAAIAAADSGNIVLVNPGTYYEQINFLGKKHLIVAGTYLTTGDTSMIECTIIDGSNITNTDSGSIVNFISGEDTTSVLYGFTIANGTKGTTYLINPTLPIRSGGAIYLSNSGGKIVHNHIRDNLLSTGPGVTIAGGAGIGNNASDISPWVIIDHNIIENNVCTSSATEADGAGLMLWCNAIISNNTIQGNEANSTGASNSWGGGFSLGSDAYSSVYSTCTVTNNKILNNKASATGLANGGGAYFQSISLTFSGNIVEGNQVIAPYNTGAGGGIRINIPKDGSLVMNNTFTGNTCDGIGGGLNVDRAVAYSEADTLMIDGNYFRDNSAKDGGGISNNYLTVMQNNVFKGNSADSWGGAVFQRNATMGNVQGHKGVMINNSFMNNSAGQLGGAVYSFKTKPVIVNCIFWSDSTTSGNGMEVSASLAEDNISGINGSKDTLYIAFCDIDSTKVRGPVFYGDGNINEDPKFIEPEILLLDSTQSPCLDHGTELFTTEDGFTVISPDHDIRGLPRYQDFYYDMGAYEQILVIGVPERNPISSFDIYPNPFTVSTTISYDLSASGNVIIQIFDLTGRLIDEPVNSIQTAGTKTIIWNSGRIPSGTYILRLTTKDGTVNRLVVKL